MWVIVSPLSGVRKSKCLIALPAYQNAYTLSRIFFSKHHAFLVQEEDAFEIIRSIRDAPLQRRVKHMCKVNQREVLDGGGTVKGFELSDRIGLVQFRMGWLFLNRRRAL
jgi:hypothetical protein